MKNLYDTLEFNKIQEKLNLYIKTEVGKNLVNTLELSTDFFLLQKELSFVEEMMNLIVRFGTLPINNSSDLAIKIGFAKKGGILTPKDLNDIAEDIETSSKVISFVKKCEGNYENIKDFIKDFNVLNHLSNSIKGVISPSLTIYDNASSKLKSIRTKIVSTQQELTTRINSLVRTYSSILSDGNITLRNDHFVLPVKTTEKNKIQGIIHDVSNTGETTFIEPNSIVELNNKIYVLKLEEQEEIKRILLELTKEVLSYENEILTNNQMLGYLDFVQAKSLYGNEIDGYVATLEKEQQIHLIGAKHPLLNKDTCIPNSFELNKDHRIMIITGPNAGGKTVALKTVGLLILMNQCGLPLPTSKKPILSIFNNIFLDIGDNQSIQDNLSTFSAHITNIAQIVKNIGGKDIVLIDELGTGTSPNEGEALAISVINEILFKNSFGIISSHFEGVKILAMQNDNIINASALFDEEKLLPTYKIKVGMPGKSYGVDVASRLGMPAHIIENAKNYLANHQEQNLDNAINKLEKQFILNEKLSEELNAKLKNIEAKEIESNKILANIDKIKEEAMLEAEEQKEELLKKARIEIDSILKELKENEIKLHTITAAKKALENLETEEIEVDSPNQEVEINDYVKIKDTNMQGKIIRKVKNNITVITQEGLSINTTTNKVIKTMAPAKKVAPRMTKGDQMIFKQSVPLELNVIGLHVDEALEKVEKYLDTCLARKIKSCRLIHGSGTGALRSAIHNYLKTLKSVDSFRLGGAGEGGVGATVVTFK
ncbi:MAG: endonuclease MutS2 [Bacilli bacterium]|nr:endonuclease MutS2 [Bacilli bacterium]